VEHLGKKRHLAPRPDKHHLAQKSFVKAGASKAWTM
jgi:hypothetical protein